MTDVQRLHVVVVKVDVIDSIKRRAVEPLTQNSDKKSSFPYPAFDQMYDKQRLGSFTRLWRKPSIESNSAPPGEGFS